MNQQQEVILIQLLHKLALTADHTVMDQMTLQVLTKISDRLDTILDILIRLASQQQEARADSLEVACAN